MDNWLHNSPYRLITKIKPARHLQNCCRSSPNRSPLRLNWRFKTNRTAFIKIWILILCLRPCAWVRVFLKRWNILLSFRSWWKWWQPNRKEVSIWVPQIKIAWWQVIWQVLLYVWCEMADMGRAGVWPSLEEGSEVTLRACKFET